MKKKSMVIIIIVVIMVGIGFYVFSGNFNQGNVVKVGDANFNIPKGYYEGNINDGGAINLTNGNNTIFLAELNNTDIINYVNDYKLDLVNKNVSIDIINYTIDDVIIYKTVNRNDTNNIHYWFVKNDKMYTVYTWDGDVNIEDVVVDFIKSAKSPF